MWRSCTSSGSADHQDMAAGLIAIDPILPKFGFKHFHVTSLVSVTLVLWYSDKHWISQSSCFMNNLGFMGHLNYEFSVP